MARVLSLLGAVGSLATGEASPAEPSHVAACEADTIPSNMCCCQTCNVTGSVFGVTLTTTCLQEGGQCKREAQSSYMRPPVSESVWLTNTRSQLEPEQVHVVGGRPDEVTVVFVGRFNTSAVELQDGNTTTAHFGYSTTYSAFQHPMSWNGYEKSSRGWMFGSCVAEDGFPDYGNSSCYYTSDLIHRVQISGLVGGRSYRYRPQTGAGRWYEFRTPPAVGSPIKFAVAADVGQTPDSQLTMQHMQTFAATGAIDCILVAGDLAYADGYQDAWDNWGRISEPLLSAVPSAFGVGNHEHTNGFENFVGFLPRYGWPAPGGFSPLWYSFDAGLAHVIMLCSYCDFDAGSVQGQWLRQDLSTVDRRRTPWVLVTEHVPFYTSNLAHSMKEGASMRNALEDLFYEYKVDFVFNGHVHAYERTTGVYKDVPTCDGPMYITVGDGGNHEGPACPWNQTHKKWSARREFSFGHGILNIKSASEAEWTWHRNQDGRAVEADVATFAPAAGRCPPDGVAVLV